MNKSNMNTRWLYDAPQNSCDGCLKELVPQLKIALPYDKIVVDKQEAVDSLKPFTLLFRKGAKKIFSIQLIRKTGRWIVEVGGGKPEETLKALRVCKNHFDDWFGVQPQEIDESL